MAYINYGCGPSAPEEWINFDALSFNMRVKLMEFVLPRGFGMQGGVEIQQCGSDAPFGHQTWQGVCVVFVFAQFGPSHRIDLSLVFPTYKQHISKIAKSHTHCIYFHVRNTFQQTQYHSTQISFIHSNIM